MFFSKGMLVFCRVLLWWFK